MSILNIHTEMPEASLIQRDSDGAIWYSFKAEFVIRVTPHMKLPRIPIRSMEISSLAAMSHLCAPELYRYDMIDRNAEGDNYLWTKGGPIGGTQFEIRAPKRYIDFFDDHAYLYYDMNDLLYVFTRDRIDGIVQTVQESDKGGVA